MSSTLNEENLEKKFQTVTNTQDSIQTLSLWILHHKNHHKKIVQIWMKVLKKAKISHRLVLFYLANDVIQHSKRKGVVQFTESFAEVLKAATLLVRDDKIKHSIERVFNIWEERSVYEPDFIAELHSIIAGAKVRTAAASKLIAEFKPQKVVEKIHNIQKVEEESNAKLTALTSSKIDATNTEVLRRLKDRSHGQQFSRDFEESVKCLEAYIKALEKEVAERAELIAILEQSEIYYDEQMGEAKQVANAYKSFGIRVKTLQKKLLELLPTLASPVPSPCPDAPSPTNSDDGPDLNLAKDKEEPGVMTSWLGSFTTNSQVMSGASTLDSRISGNSTLERRLSNLMEKIPNLPPSIQNTIFGSQSTSGSTPVQERDGSAANSPSALSKSQMVRLQGESVEFGNGTPLKDEDSGQNTPLQDEDAPATTLSFLSKFGATDGKIQLTPKKSSNSTPLTTASIVPGMPKISVNSLLSGSDRDVLLLSQAGGRPEIPAALGDILKKLTTSFSSASSPFGPPSWLSVLTEQNVPLQEEKDKSPVATMTPQSSSTTRPTPASHQVPCYTSAPSKHPTMSPVNTDSAKSCRVTSTELPETKSVSYTGTEENMEPMDMDLDDSDPEDLPSQHGNVVQNPLLLQEPKKLPPGGNKGNFMSAPNPGATPTTQRATSTTGAPKMESSVAQSPQKERKSSQQPLAPPPLPPFQRNMYLETRPLEPPPMPSFPLGSGFSSEGFFNRMGSPNLSNPFQDSRGPVRSPATSNSSPALSMDDVPEKFGGPRNEKPKMGPSPVVERMTQNASSSTSPAPSGGKHLITAEDKSSLLPSPKSHFPNSLGYSEEKRRNNTSGSSLVARDGFKQLPVEPDSRSSVEAGPRKNAECIPALKSGPDMKCLSQNFHSGEKAVSKLLCGHSGASKNDMNASSDSKGPTFPAKENWPSITTHPTSSSQGESVTEALDDSNIMAANSRLAPEVRRLELNPSLQVNVEEAKHDSAQQDTRNTAGHLESVVKSTLNHPSKMGNSENEHSSNPLAEGGMEAMVIENDEEEPPEYDTTKFTPDEELAIVNRVSEEKVIENQRKPHPKLPSAVSIVSTIQTIQSVRRDAEERWWADSVEAWEPIPNPHQRQQYAGRSDGEGRPLRQDRRFLAEHNSFRFERPQNQGYNNRFQGRERRPFNHYGRPPNSRFVNREPRWQQYPPRY